MSPTASNFPTIIVYSDMVNGLVMPSYIQELVDGSFMQC